MSQKTDTSKFAAVTRRTVLKGAGAAVAAAALTGCGSSSDSKDEYVEYAPDLEMERDAKVAFHTGPFDCGGACVHKIHVKNDRITCLTSAGDIERVTLNENDPENSDEWVAEAKDKPMQYRACVRGYGYVQRLYQPDRIKYPLMRVEGAQRGDPKGFKRVSWEEACEKIGQKMVPIYQEAASLGYVPAYGDPVSGTLSNKSNMNLCVLYGYSNPSQGLIEAAKHDAVGQNMWRNSRNDRLNSGLIITWGADPSRQSNWENGTYWILQKAKERGIPIITVTPTCGANAAIYSNSVTATIPADPALSTSGATVKIPGWLPVRPGTDGALLTALMYVIYRRKLYDFSFLKTEHTGGTVADRNCFGFWKGDSVVSVAPAGTHKGFPKASAGISKNENFAGHTFEVPDGYSFEEYLVSLEDQIGADGWSPINLETSAGSNVWRPAKGGWLKGPKTGPGLINTPSERDNTIYPGFDTAACGADDYYGVLDYAARVTGVNALVIEALACFYINNKSGKPSLIDIGCGPQRQYGGAEYYWLAMNMACVSGFADKKGGGLGLAIFSVPDQFNAVSPNSEGVYSKETACFTNNPLSATANRIVVNNQNLPELIVTGRDGRDAARFKADTAYSTNGVLTNLESIKIRALFMNWAGNQFITHANINKNRDAFNKLDLAVYIGQTMTPTALMCDFIFPEESVYERNYSSVGAMGVTMYHDARFMTQNVLKHYMYGIQPSSYTRSLMSYHIVKALKDAGVPNINTELTKPETVDTVAPAGEEFDDMDAIKDTVEKYRTCAAYDRANGLTGEGEAYSYEQVVRTGAASMPITSDKPIIAMKHHRTPGGRDGLQAFATTTGYYNFYSPFWGDPRIRRDHLVDGVPADNFTYSAGWRTPVAKYVPAREGYERFFKNNNPYEDFTGITGRSGRKYTLQYLTNKSVQRIHTVHGNVAIINNSFRMGVYMNSSDAAARGINDGDTVYVYNDRGCMKVPAIVSNYMAPGVVSVEHGSWYKPSTEETYRITYEKQMGTETVTKDVPVDLGGSGNTLTDDMFVIDPLFVRNTATVHAGPCEVSKTKPE